ncbi:hypothetical protein SELMODRAFT_411383 [Selaginella moellendorffii]|uniref:SUN domain-containing protein n=1 Tax=Selaginella moellendorffii TaxID=88036 RepID=D8RHG6_SELML|nr:hypothetical protein SELMODRAFT_411383 [Selaginella moellendorffii]
MEVTTLIQFPGQIMNGYMILLRSRSIKLDCFMGKSSWRRTAPRYLDTVRGDENSPHGNLAYQETLESQIFKSLSIYTRRFSHDLKGYLRQKPEDLPRAELTQTENYRRKTLRVLWMKINVLDLTRQVKQYRVRGMLQSWKRSTKLSSRMKIPSNLTNATAKDKFPALFTETSKRQATIEASANERGEYHCPAQTRSRGRKVVRTTNFGNAEEKFVVVELSEKTLVDTIDYDLYSSNVGAAGKPDVCAAKGGVARYLKLRILAHYGAEFYCTLSAVEVFGVTIERMLEGWIGRKSNVDTGGDPSRKPDVGDKSDASTTPGGPTNAGPAGGSTGGSHGSSTTAVLKEYDQELSNVMKRLKSMNDSWKKQGGGPVPKFQVTSLAEYKRMVNLNEYEGPFVRLEEYNYAAAANGARVVSFNKEAQGGGNILNRIKDQHYSSPCSAEDKFVVVELSKEIYVGAIIIVNFDEDSSYPRDLELLGSLEYPTEEWKLLGRFEAKDDIRSFQAFILPRTDHSVRYLKLRILSHHREESICTLSTMMVYEPLIKRTRPQVFDAPFKPEPPPSPEGHISCTCLGEEIEKVIGHPQV